jgi:uncharacterized protein YcbK (DUF882 family)
MKQFNVVGGFTVIHYHSKIYEADSADNARKLAEAELEQCSYIYYDWEIDDVKEIDDFEIIEVNMIKTKPTSQRPS